MINTIGTINDLKLIDLITKISEIVKVDDVALIDKITDLALVDRITLIDAITAIGSIGTIGSVGSLGVAVTSNNLFRNGDFVTLDLTYWLQVGTQTVINLPTFGNVVKFGAGSNYIFQSFPNYLASQTPISYYVGCGTLPATMRLKIFFTDSSSEQNDYALSAIGMQQVFYLPTTAKRIAYIAFVPTVNTDYLYLGKVSAINDPTINTNVTLADSENRVLPKAKGKTTIIPFAAYSSGGGVLYTVTAGKTFYLTGGSLTIDGTTAGYGLLIVNGVNSISGVLAVAGQIVIPINPCVPMPYPAGTIFAITTSVATVFISANLIGWEE